MNRIVIATHNRKKAGEMLTILSRALPGVEWLTLADFPEAPEPEETGTTYEENARIKAESACRATGLPSVADDAGLEIDALGGEPGLYSKRFAGEETPFPTKMGIILDRMTGLEGEARTARFRCWVAIARPETKTEAFEGICEGHIGLTMEGEGGFGYDPIFVVRENGRTMATLTADEKHAVSHRGKVLASVTEWLQQMLAAPPKAAPSSPEQAQGTLPGAASSTPIQVKLREEYITLGQLLKVADVIQTGGEAKAWLADNSALINGEPDNRRGRKIRPGDRVEFPNGTVVDAV